MQIHKKSSKWFRCTQKLENHRCKLVRFLSLSLWTYIKPFVLKANSILDALHSSSFVTKLLKRFGFKTEGNFTSTRIVITRKTDNKSMEKLAPLYNASENVKQCSHLGEQSDGSLKS